MQPAQLYVDCAGGTAKSQIYQATVTTANVVVLSSGTSCSVTLSGNTEFGAKPTWSVQSPTVYCNFSLYGGPGTKGTLVGTADIVYDLNLGSNSSYEAENKVGVYCQ